VRARDLNVFTSPVFEYVFDAPIVCNLEDAREKNGTRTLRKDSDPFGGGGQTEA